MTNNSDKPPPEGPECRRIYEGIRQASINRQLIEVNILGGRFLKKPPPGLDSLKLPIEVIGGGVRGKFIWLEFEEIQTMWITLGMSGYWSQEIRPHSHLQLRFSDGTSLYFVDQRRFGTIKFSDKIELDKKLKTLGIDPLNDSNLTITQAISQLMKSPKKTIVEALMDQSIFAGVGNYIKCEVLYRSRVSPHRLVETLTQTEIGLIWTWIQLIIQASYVQGGASIRNYRQVGGEFGNFVFDFEVYGQSTDPLGNTVIREITKDGRTTHWIPLLQV
jgi:formamidopyrimidine-DNA glycosylase